MLFNLLLLPCIWLYKGFITVITIPTTIIKVLTKKNSNLLTKKTVSNDKKIEKEKKKKEKEKLRKIKRAKKLERLQIINNKKKEKLRIKIQKKAEKRRIEEAKILQKQNEEFEKKEQERIAREERAHQIIEKRKLKEKLKEEEAKQKKDKKTWKEKLSIWYNNLSFIKNKNNELELKRETLLIDFDSEDANRSDKKIRYKYLAKNESGKLEKGYFEAYSKLDVQSFLLSEGYEVYEIVATKGIDSFFSRWSLNFKISKSDLSFFLTQLSTYIKAGVSLSDSLKIIIEQTKKTNQKMIYKKVLYELVLGDNFSEALEKTGNIFPKLLINMIRTSEMAGNLVETLDNMAEYYAALNRTKKQMISAMIYPIMILCFAVGALFFLLIYVIPQFITIYEGLDAELPRITVVIINISDFLKNNYLYVLIGIAVTITLFILLYKNIKAFRTAMQYIFMHIPFIKDIIIYNEITIFTKTLGTLIKHNIFITDSMEILLKVTSNEIYKMLIIDTVTNLARGDNISESFKGQWSFPQIAYQMLVTGEKTGQLDTMMLRVSEFYEEQHRNKIQQMKVFIEPIMIIFIAGIVGVILLAVIIPMFDMYSSIS